MENNSVKKNAGSKAGNIFRKIAKFFLRWHFMIMLLATAAYSIFIWNKYIVNVEWSEERKNSYVEEQSVFSFDRKEYQKALDFMNDRNKRFTDGNVDIPKDIFFPE